MAFAASMDKGRRSIHIIYAKYLLNSNIHIAAQHTLKLVGKYVVDPNLGAHFDVI